MTLLDDVRTRLPILTDSAPRVVGELIGVAVRYEAALLVIARHGNMSAAIARHALEHQHENQREEQHPTRTKRPSPHVAKPEATSKEREDDKHDENGAQQASVHGSPRRYWVSWYGQRWDDDMPNPPGVVHAWVSGERSDGMPAICAVVDAVSEDLVKRIIPLVYKVVEWRFVEEMKSGWMPDASRFPT